MEDAVITWVMTSQSLETYLTSTLLSKQPTRADTIQADIVTMNTDNGIKPIVHKRINRKSKSNSSKYEIPFRKYGVGSETDSGDNCPVKGIDTAAESETNQDSRDVGKPITQNNQGPSTTSSKLKNHIQSLINDEEPAKRNAWTVKHKLANETSPITDKVVIPNVSSESVIQERNVKSQKAESACPNNVNVETVAGLSDRQTQSTGSIHTRAEDNCQKICDKADNTNDYPENLNPFADSTSDPDDGSEILDSSRCDDVHSTEHDPIRKTTKTRPSLYPWRPFAGETIHYQSHMIPARNTAKKRPSLYPWRPFGEQEYPEELNPFNEIVQNDTNEDNGNRHLNRALEDDSKHPNNEQRFALHAPSKDTPTQEIREEQKDVLSPAEDDDVEVEKPKRIGRGKKFLKTVRKKFRKFWDRILRR